MGFSVRRIFLFILTALILASCATSKSNYAELNRVFSKQRYYVPSKKYKTACKSLNRKNKVSKKFTLIKRKPKKRAEQP